MRTTWRPALVLFAAFTLLTGVLYPLLITAIARVAFPRQARGSMIERDGRVIGSQLIGQPFDDPRYFWGRLSATSAMPYDAGASSGSNFGPSNPALVAAARARIELLRATNASDDPIPIDLVTASGSGLDPHVSPAAARWQIPRVATARGLEISAVGELVESHVEPRQLGVLGEPVVNVLELNLALDALAPDRL
jgi:K+-transporting ATPase ATPase C chain